MEPEIELLLMLVAACAIAATLFYGGAFLIQRVKLLWIEIESNRIDMLAKRASVKMALDESDLKTQVVRLDENGLPPVSRKMIDSGLTTDAALQIAMAYIDAQRTHAPTPTHLTYAPHIKQDRLAVGDNAPAQLEQLAVGHDVGDHAEQHAGIAVGRVIESLVDRTDLDARDPNDVGAGLDDCLNLHFISPLDRYCWNLAAGICTPARSRARRCHTSQGGRATNTPGV